MPILVIAAVLTAVLLLALAGGTWFFFDYAVRRKPRQEEQEFPPDSPWGQMKYKMDAGKSWINTFTLETVEMQSYDGLRLKAHILEQPASAKKTVLMMHGFRAQDFCDFCVSVKYFYESGYNIILADQRCHGESEGKYITFGIRERYDCRDWARFAVRRYGEDSTLVLMGVSMGCATALMSLGLDLPDNVRAVVADCGYTSPRAIFSYVIRNSYHLPAFPILNLCAFMCRAVAGFSIDAYSTLEALETNEIPVIFIHGAKDKFVPPFMTKENYDACKAPKELVVVDNAEHAMSFPRDTEKCWAAISRFLREHNCG